MKQQNFNEEHADCAIKHGLSKQQRKMHKQARKQRAKSRGRVWQ